jgi:signal transduction histidine kinase
MVEAGEAIGRVETLGRRYAGAIRVVTLVPSIVVAVLAADDNEMRRKVTIVGVLLCAWSVFYVSRVVRGHVTWVTVVDGALLCGLAVLTAQLTPVGWLASGKTWIRPLATFAAVGHQYSTGWRLGVPVGAAVCMSAALASVLTRPGPIGADAVITVVWSTAIAMLARLLWTLLTRAAGRADAAFADAADARRHQLVADTVREDERMITDSLHDTAATTLLMVALGQTTGLEDALRRRADHDLQTLRAMRTGPPPVPVDLCRELRAMAALGAVAVDLHGPDHLDVPPTVARALSAATGEALTNVAKHAGAQAARIDFGTRGDTTFVEIADHGRGFDVELVPTTRRGLRASIAERVAAAGGRATVTSTPGAGTTVRLEWPA